MFNAIIKSPLIRPTFMMISQMHRGSRGLLQFGRQFLNAGTRTGTEENIPAECFYQLRGINR